MTEKHQLTVAELIELLSKLPQDAKVCMEADYGYHLCEGAHMERGLVFLEAG